MTLAMALGLGVAWPGLADPVSPVYRWRDVTVGAGGFAPAILFSPVQPGLAYLRTDMGGAYRWDAAARRWIPLQDGENESSYMGVESIAIDPVDPNGVYMAVGMYRRQPAAILRSHDAGATWQAARLPIALGGNEDGRGLGERLAIDPHERRILLFGTRHDGLWRSDDAGASWRADPAFPYRGRGLPQGRRTHGGVSFVLYDPRPASRRVFAGIADPGDEGLFLSDDAGKHWRRVGGGPKGLLPVKADIDKTGTLYISFSDGIGPNGIMRGAIWSLSAHDEWRDITPRGKGADAPGGYMGISADRYRPGVLVVSTIDRWRPGDTIWRTVDGGASWRDIGVMSTTDISATPFLSFGKKDPGLGHWMTGLAIDPFDPGHIAYTTGATVYATRDGESERTLTWRPWVQGIEQTAIISLLSPTAGAPLVSGFGDLGGFVHRRLDKSPDTMFTNPFHTNTNMLDYAGRRPSILVRSGNVHADQVLDAGLGWSADGGASWQPLQTPDRSSPDAREGFGRAAISVSADGRRFYVGAEHGWMTEDRGKNWTRIADVPEGARIVTDKVDPRLAWAVDGRTGRLLRSRDGGRHFRPVAALGACDDLRDAAPRNRESPSALQASPFAAGELYLACAGNLYRSSDGGQRFVRVDSMGDVTLFGLGKGARACATGLFAVTGRGHRLAIWRSLDSGTHWQRIDDPAHRWGNRIRVISGDPKTIGRIYIGTDGRGIVYGDPVAGQ